MNIKVVWKGLQKTGYMERPQFMDPPKKKCVKKIME